MAGSTGKRSRWTQGRVVTLLEHLDDNKGDQGCYSKDNKQAVEGARRLLRQIHPGFSVTCLQIRKKLNSLLRTANDTQNCQKNTRDFWRDGSALLGRKLSMETKSSVSPSQDRSKRQRQNTDQGTQDTQDNSVNISSLESQTKSSIQSKEKEKVLSLSSSAPKSSADDHVSVIATSSETGLPTIPTGSSSQPAMYDLLVTSKFTARHPVQGTKTSVKRPPSPKVVRMALPGQFHDSSESPETQAGLIQNLGPDPTKAIRRYLLDDPRKFLPKCSDLKRSAEEIVKAIKTATDALLANRRVEESLPSGLEISNDLDKVPDLFSASTVKSFFDLAGHVFGATTQDELFSKSAQSFVSMRDLMRALVAAAIHDWVLDGGYVHLPDLDAKTDRSSIYENRLKELHPQLHEQLLHESKYVYVNEKTDFSKIVPDLGHRFIQATNQFLNSNDVRLSGAKYGAWSISLDNIFKLSLQLRAQLDLYSHVSRRWPRAGEAFHEYTMMMDRWDDSTEGAKVQVALFPALISKRPTEDRCVSIVISKAVVVLL